MRDADPIATSVETSDIEPTVAARDEPERPRIRSRWGYGGFAIGLGMGSVYTAAQVASFGYAILPLLFVWNLIWAPALGVVLGLALCSRPEKPRDWSSPRVRLGVLMEVVAFVTLLIGPFPYHFAWNLVWWNLIWLAVLGAVIGLALRRIRYDKPWEWRRPQLRVHTLMVIVAYVAILLGAGISTFRIGTDSSRYLQKKINSAEMARVFREQGQKSETDAKLLSLNVAELRAGKIPVTGLIPGQREFLQSLEDDPKLTPDHRKYRRGLITEGQESRRIQEEQNAVLLGRLTEHFEKLAIKYEWYRWHPWLPVEPDPPLPQ